MVIGNGHILDNSNYSFGIVVVGILCSTRLGFSDTHTARDCSNHSSLQAVHRKKCCDWKIDNVQIDSALALYVLRAGGG